MASFGKTALGGADRPMIAVDWTVEAAPPRAIVAGA